MKTNIPFFIICCLIFVRMRIEKICRENQNAHFMFKYTFFPEILAVFEIMWKNTVQPDRRRMAI